MLLHEAILYKIYMVYRDFITTLIIGVLNFNITPISTFSGAIVSEIWKCLPEAICLFYYKIYIVYRDFITTLIIGVLNYTIILNFTFSRAFIRYRIVSPPLLYIA